MTVKKILSLLLLTSLGLSAQTPPNEAAAPAPGDPARNAARIAAAVSDAPPAAAPGFPALPAPVPRSPRRAAATPAAPGAVPAPAAPGGGPASAAPTPGAVSAPSPAATPAPAPASSADAKPAEETLFKPGELNFVGAEIWQVLSKYYSELVGRNILRSPTAEAALKAPVFFVNQTALTRSEAMQAFEAIFAMNGLALVPAGDKFLKAVPLTEAIQAGAKPMVVTNSTELHELGQYVTYIVQLKYVKPTEMMQLLTPFQKMNASVPIDSSQILVLRDITENVKRMLEMIERVDVAFSSEFESEVIPIKFAKAEEIASALSALSGSGSTTTVGSRPAGGGGASGIGTRPGMGGYSPGATGIPGQSNPMGSNPNGPPSGTPSFSDRINSIISRAAKSSTSGSGDFQIIGQNKIVADVRSNSLMVFASKQDMLTIKKIINQLDVVLAQVLIETIILDVSLGNSWNYGLQAGQRPKMINGTNSAVGGMINNKNNPLGTGLGFLNQFTTSTNGSITPNTAFSYPDAGGLSYFGKIGGALNWDIMLQAAASDSTVNVIQTPQILTTHATAGSIFIGKTVPYVSGTYYGGGYGGGPSSSYQQMRVGIGLNVTPYINQDGLVVMKIDEQIDEISGSTALTGVGDVPNTTSRTISAEVAVRDRETIILGGFIRNSEQKSVSGVPILKDIPLLGALFTSRGNSKDRSELLVLMRPTVLRTPEIAAQQTYKEKAKMPGVQHAEVDLERDNQKRRLEYINSQLDAKSKKPHFDKVTPFTPEEERLYGNPPTAQP